MFYIDPHIHRVSRITDDYLRLARAWCAAVSEPAFRVEYDRETDSTAHECEQDLS